MPLTVFADSRSLDDYSRDNAITDPKLATGRHRSFDQVWKDWAQDQRRLGREKVTVQELHEVMADALGAAGHCEPQRSARVAVAGAVGHSEVIAQVYRCTTGQVSVLVMPSTAWTRATTSLPSSSILRASAWTITS